MKVGVIGCGAIGGYLMKKVKKEPGMELVFVYDTDKKKLSKYKKLALKNSDEIGNKEVDIVVEAASQQAAKKYAPKVLKYTNMLMMSVGALADKKFYNKIKRICEKSDTKLFVPSGAVVGVDGLIATRDFLDSVTLVTRKNPKSLGRKDKKEKVLYEGSARKACKLFPKNINVAAIVSLAGLGFEKTKVKIISDPKISRNCHKIIAVGSPGRFETTAENIPTPENPKTSFLASLAAFNVLKKLNSSIEIV